jgi:hypothetical protein
MDTSGTVSFGVYTFKVRLAVVANACCRAGQRRAATDLKEVSTKHSASEVYMDVAHVVQYQLEHAPVRFQLSTCDML